MLVKRIKYTDFDGNERTEDFYFNLTEEEAFRLSITKNGGYERWINTLIESQDAETLLDEFSKIILNAYGKKSLDGRRFIKTPELAEEFKQTQAYSDMIIGFLRDPQSASDFLKGIVPNEPSSASAGAPVLKDNEVTIS